MGAWGYTAFENDDALDWVATFETHSTIEFLRDTVTVIADEAYVEEEPANNAIAAATVAAALGGYQDAKLPQLVAEWVARHTPPTDSTLVPLAISAVERVLTDSEAAEIWADSGNETWFQEIRNLLAWLRQM